MKKRMNLYQEYYSLEKKNRNLSSSYYYVLIIFAAAIIMVALAVSSFLPGLTLEKQNIDLKNYLNNPANISEVARVDALKTKVDTGVELKTKLESLNAVLKDKNTLQGELIDTINMAVPNNLNIVKINMNGGIIEVEYVAKTISEPVIFVNALNKNPLFQEVNYPGYQKEVTVDEETSTSTTRYTGTVTLVLKGGY